MHVPSTRYNTRQHALVETGTEIFSTREQVPCNILRLANGPAAKGFNYSSILYPAAPASLPSTGTGKRASSLWVLPYWLVVAH